MDNKRLLVVMLIAIPLVLLWEPAIVWIGRQMGYDMSRKPPTTQVATTNASGSGSTASGLETPAGGSGPGIGPVESTTGPGAGPVADAAPGAVRVLDSVDRGSSKKAPEPIGSDIPDDDRYALGVRFSPLGASIDGVTLNRYKKSVGSPARYVFQEPYEGFADASRPMGSGEITITVDGVASKVDLSRVHWTQRDRSVTRAEFSVDLGSDAGPIVRAVKTFTIKPREEAKATTGGYEVVVEMKFENLSGRAVTVSQQFTGPLTPPKELDRGSDRNIVGGYVESGKIFRIRHDYTESFSEKYPRYDYTKSKNDDPLLWVGACSVYFNAILRPDPLPGAQGISPDYIQKAEAVALDPANPDSHNRHVVTQFQTTDLALAPGQAITLPMRLFVGPRLRSLMNNDYFASLPFRYDETLVLTAGPCAFCTFQWLVDILVGLLGYIQIVVRDWGISIIVLVLIVRALLHPITKRAQVNMMGMAKFGPELERIKKKYADNKDELNRAMMQFYKEHGATPVLGCLPMLLQMPIWIALFSALQSTFELRQAPFLQIGGTHLTWIKDLSQPDHLVKFENTFTLLGMVPISGLNILPFLLAIVFFLQQKYTPKPPASTPEQLQQQKMMQWMTLLFPVFLYGGPSGLNLYILASTTFGIIESKIIRDHIKQKEAAEQAGAVIVDAEDTPRGKKSPAGSTGPAKPQGWLARKMAEMQRRVEEVQKQAEKQQRKKPR
ncbi:MAG TPA: YidC/Oxa1 family insertase periplasmic-domain containing protein [Tepidisphaeraceae bacterium]|nr:YidC/Oxa1 family insertase periplasmic-domain containing protein [Tepidisphaeraceae bacterium]